jgi:hypothetical protein
MAQEKAGKHLERTPGNHHTIGTLESVLCTTVSLQRLKINETCATEEREER